jgi:rubrerythrin
MGEDKTVKILKSAILLEKRGRAFYTTVAQQTDKDAVRRFFGQMADEEKTHIRMLSEQYRVYCEKKSFKSGAYSTEPAGAIASTVMSKELKDQISAAGFESAAIAAAMAMEKNAITLYSQRAEEATDPNEKALYEWLADWEKNPFGVSGHRRARSYGDNLERQQLLAFLKCHPRANTHFILFVRQFARAGPDRMPTRRTR